MKKLVSLLIATSLVSLFSGCASGPDYNTVKNTIPPLAPDSGRIYMYRATAVGVAIQPTISINGKDVGTAKPLGFFYVDETPGDYKIQDTTEVTRTLSLTLDKGQTRYVRFDLSFGFFVGHVSPVLVENSVGEKEIASCKYTGVPLAGASSTGTGGN
jgi:hypothetical protein